MTAIRRQGRNRVRGDEAGRAWRGTSAAVPAGRSILAWQVKAAGRKPRNQTAGRRRDRRERRPFLRAAHRRQSTRAVGCRRGRSAFKPSEALEHEWHVMAVALGGWDGAGAREGGEEGPPWVRGPSLRSERVTGRASRDGVSAARGAKRRGNAEGPHHGSRCPVASGQSRSGLAGRGRIEGAAHLRGDTRGRTLVRDWRQAVEFALQRDEIASSAFGLLAIDEPRQQIPRCARDDSFTTAEVVARTVRRTWRR